MNDVWVRRSADVDSNHHLLMAKLALKLRKVSHGFCRKKKRFDTTRLSNPKVRLPSRTDLACCRIMPK